MSMETLAALYRVMRRAVTRFRCARQRKTSLRLGFVQEHTGFEQRYGLQNDPKLF